MEISSVIAAFGALAQATRLNAYRLLVQAGPDGLPAGRIGEQLGLPSATLAFHLKELKNANLVRCTRHGRLVIYAAEYSTMNDLIGFLTKDCCGGGTAAQPFCTPASADISATPAQRTA